MNYTLHLGDCRDVMRTMDACSVDTVVCDPPYGLSFMGKDWDHGIPGVAFWQAALRVAKPGAMLLAFGGTRTHHRLMVAIEDAGWEIRDVVMWLYGSGFPKSHDISKGIDKAAGALGTQSQGANYAGGEYAPRDKRFRSDYGYTFDPSTPLAQQWDGWGTALKPAYEPIVLAMKPLDGTFAQNAARHGVAGLAIDKGRIEANGEPVPLFSKDNQRPGTSFDVGSRRTGDFSTAGRWPANLILDEEACTQLGEPSRFFYTAKASRSERERGLEGMPLRTGTANRAGRGLCAKCGRQRVNVSGQCTCVEPEWIEETHPSMNHHPTVKPLSLMRYLVRLTSTPTGGVVLDPFMGSGSTGIAALQEGRSFVGIELHADYYAIAEKRIANVTVQPELVAA